MGKKIIVFCPNPHSLYTISVCELLIKKGFSIECVVVRRFTFKRFKNEFARDGKRLLRKIWKKLVLKEKAYNDMVDSIVSFRERESLNIRNINEFKHNGTKIIYCNTLNDTLVERTLKGYDEKLVIFTGGGIIRKNVLENAGDGIINCHMGILPRYRGMDLPEWCILEDKIEEIGITLHFMDSGIDTGDILKKVTIGIKGHKTVASLRASFEVVMVQEMVSVVEDYLNNKVKKVRQKEGLNRQYFIVHERLYQIAEKRLKSLTSIMN